MAKKKRCAGKRGKQNDGLHILIVEARFYDNIFDELLRGTWQVADKAGARYGRVGVPDGLEIPSAIAVDGARRPAPAAVARKNTLA